MTYDELEQRINELKYHLSEMEQRLIDNQYVDMDEFRQAIKKLNWLRIQRDLDVYTDYEDMK